MRGYSMIEKEIELIESRNNKDALLKSVRFRKAKRSFRR